MLKDPKWTETFSDRSENLNDAMWNFIVYPTGVFLNRILFKDFFEIFFDKLDFAKVKKYFYRFFGTRGSIYKSDLKKSRNFYKMKIIENFRLIF